ncbi:hypothetical protein AOB46_11010 [Chryseobacterium indologenes]|uniref:Uncharacterized protein n=1 Tax=Chryseobacterium indologenes TaxID=253 RepID=A0A0N0ZVV8_CHRID|nr:hypothetical protein AOB46_11010 [Chryseobacterium indologenes]
MFFPVLQLNSKGKNFYIKNFKEEFKQAAFCNCLLYGYNDKSLASRLTQIDKTFYNPIMQNIFSEELTEISINEYKLIKKDSLNFIQTSSEANAGKKVL